MGIGFIVFPVSHNGIFSNFQNSLTSNLDKEIFRLFRVGLGGLGVKCSTRDPRSVGSNLAEADGFLQDVKILSTSPPGGTLSWGSRV